jgi:hypothetical protein
MRHFASHAWTCRKGGGGRALPQPLVQGVAALLDELSAARAQRERKGGQVRSAHGRARLRNYGAQLRALSLSLSLSLVLCARLASSCPSSFFSGRGGMK